MERSVYVIKPEAMTARDKIAQLIEASGLQIIARKLTRITEHAIEVFYPDLSSDLHKATIQEYGAGLSEIGIVKGCDAIARLLDLAGQHVNPADCGTSTIRGRFGSSIPVRIGNALYYRNAFHRTKERSDVAHELSVFEELPDLSDTIPN